MKISEVKKLSPLERFLYWIEERHSIYKKRQAKKPKPWTDDEVLQSFFFTNPYRENDKVTQWFRKHIRDPLKDDPRVILATIIFRWFNYIPTGEFLILDTVGRDLESSLLLNWDSKYALQELGERRAEGKQIFTGAFMINSPGGMPKLEAICERIDNVWNDRESLVADIQPEHPTINDPGASCCMEYVHERLQKYPGLGGFMAYEVVCDLRYTYVLQGAPDVDTWCNPGPGAVRGLYRLKGWDLGIKNNASSPKVPKDWKEQTIELLHTCRTKLAHMPRMEMREVEMSLCEYDKYVRLLLGEGKSKRLYNGRS